jgi:NAD+ synthase (glutamine-hydrolysing)
MKIALAQLELKTGDLRGNTDAILREINYNSSSDVILFPELAVTGYNCGALFESDDFIHDALKHVDEIVAATKDKKCTIIFGAPRFANPDREPNGTIRLHNSAFIARNGKLIATYDKTLLANDFQHEDRKYFVPGSQLVTVNVAGKTAGILICEDGVSSSPQRASPNRRLIR